MTLAVIVNKEQDYYPAIREKLLRLLAAAGPLPDVIALVKLFMESDGVEVWPTNDPENLITQVLATASVGEMVRAGAPWMSRPAPYLEAIEAIEAQGELTLEDFLG